MNADARRGSALEVFAAFLHLGLTAFGGPIAHLSYFRQAFVERRRWLSEGEYADLVALAQFLPGPASSQVGFALGLQRAGWRGGLAAWAGFTLPSALLMALAAWGLAEATDLDGMDGLLHGLKLAAVAVVAQALLGMSRSLCPDRPRAGIAIGAALLCLTLPTLPAQLAALGLGGLLGASLLRLAPLPPREHRQPVLRRRTGLALIGLAGALLVALPLLATHSGAWALGALAVVYQAGSLVFGGGHVVLPLLQAGLVPPGWLSAESFLAGYGLAQAVPGPLFSFAAYVGAALPAPLGGWTGGLLMLVVIFLPGLLLMAGALPLWEGWRRHAGMQRAMAGLNAAVVGLLAAALYDPVWTSAVHGRTELAIALAGFGLLVVARWSPLAVVALSATAGGLLL